MRQHGLPVRDRLSARGFVAAALLTAATVAVYWGVWRFQFVNFDDDIAVLQNARIAEANAGPIGSIAELFRFERAREYLPVRDGSYLLDRALWCGLDPGGFHLTNLVIHIAAGLLLMHLAMALGASLETAVLAGAVFLLHPMQTESVAWVSGRKDLLAALFAFASWLAHERGKRFASVMLFLAGALSKATIVPLPIVFFAADTLRDRRARLASSTASSQGRAFDRTGVRRRLARIAPHLAIATLIAIVQIVTSAGAGMLRSGEERGLLASLLLAAKLPFLYLANIVWPLDLHLLYSPAIPDPRAPMDWLPLLALAIVIGLVARASSRRALLAIGGIAFLVLLAPTLGLIPFQLLMADRYAYLPMAGIALAICGLFPAGSEARQAPGKVALAAAILLAIPLGLVARREALAWRDSETLWMREISRDATHADAWLNLGTYQLNEARGLRDRHEASGAQERAHAAASNLAKAVELRAPSVAAHVNWALAASLAGDHTTALRAIAIARDAAARDPLVRYNSACVRAQAGDIDGALEDLNYAIDSDGDFTQPARLSSDPDLAPLRDDSRFTELLKKASIHRGWR